MVRAGLPQLESIVADTDPSAVVEHGMFTRPGDKACPPFSTLPPISNVTATSSRLSDSASVTHTAAAETRQLCAAAIYSRL